MNDALLAEIARVLALRQPAALATLVDARGSTPQKAGARLLVSAGGATLGTLGGGCIEAGAREAALDVLRTGEPRLLDFDLTEDIAVDYGLACGGSERILVAPVGDAAVLQAMRDASAVHRRGALVTIVAAPQGTPAGRMAAIWADGAADGDLGALQHEAAEAARAALAARTARPQLVRLASGAELFIELVDAPSEVIVAGGGHVGAAVATVAKFLGHRVAVIDDRPEFASTARFPDVDTVIAGDIERTLLDYPISPHSAVVIVTRGHKYDYQALAAAARSPAFYVGLMGSRRKVALIYRQLIADGVPPERLRDIHAPIGLNIGAVTPEEIAVSIMAEITKIRLGGDGAPLKVGERIIEKARAGARV
jgi:xanthine dehydrogenase accessory factor